MSAGLSLPVALALCAVAVAWVLLLYRLRDHRQHVVVAFLDLWQAAELQVAQSKWRSQLRALVSVGIQLLVVALLCVALLDPALWQNRSSTSHWVILLDTSASMSSLESQGSRFSMAQRELLELLSRLDDSTEILLCRTDMRTTPLLPWTRDHRALADAIRRQKPSDTVSNWRQALTRAASLLAGKSRPRLLLVTDGTVADWSRLAEEPLATPVAAEAILVGRTRYNLGILALAARALPNAPRHAEVLIELENDDDVDHEVGVEFSTGNHRILETRTLRIEAHRRQRSVMNDVAVTGHSIGSRLVTPDASHDALALDDQAYAVLPEAPRTRVAVVSNGDLYLEAAVLSDPWLEPQFIAPGSPIDPATVDAVIYAACEPETPLLRPSLFLDPPAGSRRFRRGKSLEGIGFDSWNQRSRLVQGLDLFDVQIERAQPFLPDPSDESVAFSGKSTLVMRGERDAQPFVAVAFEASRSDFVLRPIWPLFVRQVLAELLGREQSDSRQVHPFEPVNLPAPANRIAAKIRSVAFDGASQVVERDLEPNRAWSFVPNRAGLYTIDAGQRRSTVAANLGASGETRIAPLRPLRLGGHELGRPTLASKPSHLPHFVGCVLGAVLLLLFEWYAFHRRWTT